MSQTMLRHHLPNVYTRLILLDLLSRIDRTQPLHSKPPLILLLRRHANFLQAIFLQMIVVVQPKAKAIEVPPIIVGLVGCYAVLVIRGVVAASEVGEEAAEETFCGGRARGHDVHGGLGDGDGDADVPGSVGVGGREAVVVGYEAAD
jgi:hypothetical protein